MPRVGREKITVLQPVAVMNSGPLSRSARRRSSDLLLDRPPEPDPRLVDAPESGALARANADEHARHLAGVVESDPDDEGREPLGTVHAILAQSSAARTSWAARSPERTAPSILPFHS